MSEILIDYYKAIENSSVQMLEAAKVADWDGMLRFEGACTVLIEQLRHRAHTEELNAAARVEKTRIMRRILANDAQIRVLTEPWLSHFEEKFEGQKALLH
jgi:flagellar protein FliT